jgi:hypothetical protein
MYLNGWAPALVSEVTAACATGGNSLLLMAVKFEKNSTYFPVRLARRRFAWQEGLEFA